MKQKMCSVPRPETKPESPSEVTPTNRKAVQIRKVRFSDHPEVAALVSRAGLSVDSHAEWEHLWRENPSCRLYPESAMGWVLEKDDELVGYLGSVPLMYEHQGRPVPTAASRAWAVADGFGPYAVLLLGKFTSQEPFDLFLNTSANSKSFRVLEAFGMTRVPAGHWDERTVWITQPAKMLARRLRGKGVPASGALGRLLAPPLVLRSGLRNLRRARFHGLEIERSGAFDHRFDDFWNEVRTRSPRLLAVRTREVLEWQFKAPLLSR
ncbi:MAG TPA: hypothetical protein VD837_09040, partial [Terriglobales bacterium]|nr:hypothetical protein [Terriglobales bacterium]